MTDLLKGQVEEMRTLSNEEIRALEGMAIARYLRDSALNNRARVVNGDFDSMSGPDAVRLLIEAAEHTAAFAEAKYGAALSLHKGKQ